MAGTREQFRRPANGIDHGGKPRKEDLVGALKGESWGSLASGEDGLRAVEVAGAVYQSSKVGEVVHLIGPTS